jgi:hypothetical protein
MTRIRWNLVIGTALKGFGIVALISYLIAR